MTDYRTLSSTRVIAVQDFADGMRPDQVGPVIERQIQAIDAMLGRMEITPLEPVITWFDSAAADEQLVVHVARPFTGAGAPRDDHAVFDLPEVPVAAVDRHTGDLTAIGESRQRLQRQLEADGFDVAGPTREVYLSTDDDPSAPGWVVELQFPVRATAARA